MADMRAILGSIERYAAALATRCPLCQQPWTAHTVSSFVPLEHQRWRTASLVFEVACPTREVKDGR